jgi:NAD(P)-dependent dehydrogenase (short-subunit alcohol dehydrogenase family)
MKIAITGHSKGIGREFKSYYEAQGYTVLGFSRSNGYDLRDWDSLQRMLDQIKDFDLLISCAKPDFVQTTLLYEVWKLWQGQPKTILNISSVLTSMPTNPQPFDQDPMIDLYRTSKVSLEEASKQLAFKSLLPYITIVKPGHLYGNVITDDEHQRLIQWVICLNSMIEQAHANSFFIKEISLV